MPSSDAVGRRRIRKMKHIFLFFSFAPFFLLVWPPVGKSFDNACAYTQTHRGGTGHTLSARVHHGDRVWHFWIRQHPACHLRAPSFQRLVDLVVACRLAFVVCSGCSCWFAVPVTLAESRREQRREQERECEGNETNVNVCLNDWPRQISRRAIDSQASRRNGNSLHFALFSVEAKGKQAAK